MGAIGGHRAPLPAHQHKRQPHGSNGPRQVRSAASQTARLQSQWHAPALWLVGRPHLLRRVLWSLHLLPWSRLLRAAACGNCNRRDPGSVRPSCEE